MNVYDGMIARKTEECADKSGRVWMKRWELFVDGNPESQGCVIYNDYWTEKAQGGNYALYIYSPLGGDYGCIFDQMFKTREEALQKARIEIENKPSVTVEMITDTIAKLKESRYQKEMSDDFAYSNGSIDRIDRKINHLKRLLMAFADTV